MDLERAYKLASEKLTEHGLHDWNVMYDDARSRFGCCMYHKRLVTLSRALVEINDEGQVMDTILHEIAHALVGPGHGHDRVWKDKAIEIGCNGKRCYSFDVTLPAGGYHATCRRCNTHYARQRRVSRWQKHYCTKCYREGVKMYIDYVKERRPEMAVA